MDDKKEKFRVLEFVKESLEAIFDGIQDGIIVLDLDFKVLRLNQQMLSWLKKEAYEEVIGLECESLIPVIRDVCPREELKKICLEGKPYHSTLPMSLPELSGHLFEASFFPIKNESGNCGVILYLRDITKRMNIQAQVIELERYKNIGPLASGIAHEIRNPLTMIQSIAQLTLSDHEKNKELKENLESIIRHAKIANQVVTELINFARPASFQFEMVDINEVLEEACRLLRARCRKEKIEIHCELEEKTPLLKIDRDHFLQALLNFLLNAIEAMEKGGELSLSSKEENGCIKIEIEDSGRGILKFQLEHVFDPFFTTKKEGVGMGLYVARQIIDSHGGQVTLQSEENKGTKVTLSIPIPHGQNIVLKNVHDIDRFLGKTLRRIKDFFKFKKAA